MALLCYDHVYNFSLLVWKCIVLNIDCLHNLFNYFFVIEPTFKMNPTSFRFWLSTGFVIFGCYTILTETVKRFYVRAKVETFQHFHVNKIIESRKNFFTTFLMNVKRSSSDAKLSSLFSVSSEPKELLYSNKMQSTEPL